jgi:hypothetical protein
LIFIQDNPLKFKNQPHQGRKSPDYRLDKLPVYRHGYAHLGDGRNFFKLAHGALKATKPIIAGMPFEMMDKSYHP